MQTKLDAIGVEELLKLKQNITHELIELDSEGIPDCMSTGSSNSESNVNGQSSISDEIDFGIQCDEKWRKSKEVNDETRVSTLADKDCPLTSSMIGMNKRNCSHNFVERQSKRPRNDVLSESVEPGRNVERGSMGREDHEEVNVASWKTCQPVPGFSVIESKPLAHPDRDLNSSVCSLPPPPCPPRLEDFCAEVLTEDNSLVLGTSLDKGDRVNAEFVISKEKNCPSEGDVRNGESYSSVNSKNGDESHSNLNEDLDSDISEDVDELLEKPLETMQQPGKVPFPEEGMMREKLVLSYREPNHFDVLPDGWVEVTHDSGLPIYLHRETRVCTFSCPYFLGPGSVRYHKVPVSAIPCLHQARLIERIEKYPSTSETAIEDVLNGDRFCDDEEGGIDRAKIAIAKLQAPDTKVQTVEDYQKRQLDANALHEYASKLFRFKKIQIRRFKKWSTTRDYHRQKKLAEAERLGKLQPAIELPSGRPALPSSVKLITVPSLETNMKPQHKGFFMNPHGKSSVGILHEYVQKILKSTIDYVYSETRNSSTPYGCSARLKINLNSRVLSAHSIKEKLMLLKEKQKRERMLSENGEQSDPDMVILGSGFGNSKKAAKLDAAKIAVKIFIPDLEFDNDCIAVIDKKDNGNEEESNAIAIFDTLQIEDERIPDLSAKAGQPSPYLLLQECLKRNSAYGDTEIKFSSERVRHQKHQFDMHLGKHHVSVICSNKREGKQKGSQALLKKLHPSLKYWGSILQLYGRGVEQKKEARRSRNSVIKLQEVFVDDCPSYGPNVAILGKLRLEMSKIADRDTDGGHHTEERPSLSHTYGVVSHEIAAMKSEEYSNSHDEYLPSVNKINL